MNITKQAFMVLHIGFFFVLILLLLSCANVKFNGPIGVNQSTAIPVDDLILLESS